MPSSRVYGRSPLQQIQDAIQRQVDYDLIHGTYAKDPMHNGPVTLKVVDAEPDQRTLRVVMDLSLREFHARHGNDIIQDIVGRMSGALAQKAAEILDGDALERMIVSELREEIKKQVKAVVADRINEFVEEALG